MSITDYIGRTVDIVGYYGTKEFGEARLTADLSKPNDSGELITGIQKLSQRFLLKLLTEKGSIKYLPEEGCQFMTEARLGFFRTTADVLAAFSASLVDIRISLLAEEDENDPDDEKFDEAEVLAVALTGTDVYLTIKITSLAGTSRKFIAPLTVSI